MLLVVAIRPREDLPEGYEPANCAVCAAVLVTSPEVRAQMADGAAPACITCALSGARPKRLEPPEHWDGGSW